MARCPFGPHRLYLQPDHTCKRCGAELTLYAQLRELPIALYNAGRRLWDRGRLEEASGRLHAALALRPELAEAHWLLAAIAAARGTPQLAVGHLRQAQQLGAAVDATWFEKLSAAQKVSATPKEGSTPGQTSTSGR